jgi:alkylation response protein AidB-like acyl-CoA dehydrogenase
MDIAFTREHEELRQTVRRFLEKESAEASVRKLMETDSGYDTRTWERIASELSLTGLAIPEKHGGVGLGAVEMAIVFEEMGRVLYCGPFLASAALAASMVRDAATDAEQSKLLPEIASGKTIATLAIAEESGKWDADSIKMRAKRDGATWRLDGVKNYVLDGHIAGVVLVAALAGDELALFRVDGGAAGLERASLPTLDLTRKLARLTFKGVPATRISDKDIRPALSRTLTFAVAMLAAEQAGGAQRCLEMSTEYAKTRLQFGRPIGSFQAIKHKCADMLVDTEFARSAAYHAAFELAGGDEAEAREAAQIAKSYCAEAFFKAAADNIQIHGGMGFTWEHPAHLYFKRARTGIVMFGEPSEYRQKLAASLEL